MAVAEEDLEMSLETLPFNVERKDNYICVTSKGSDRGSNRKQKAPRITPYTVTLYLFSKSDIERFNQVKLNDDEKPSALRKLLIKLKP